MIDVTPLPLFSRLHGTHVVFPGKSAGGELDHGHRKNHDHECAECQRDSDGARPACKQLLLGELDAWRRLLLLVDGLGRRGHAMWPSSMYSPMPAGGLDACKCDAHRINGSVSYWWNGGGDGSVHSSVVAPAPHGLALARCLRMNASAMPYKKTRTPKPEI